MYLRDQALCASVADERRQTQFFFVVLSVCLCGTFTFSSRRLQHSKSCKVKINWEIAFEPISCRRSWHLWFFFVFFVVENDRRLSFIYFLFVIFFFSKSRKVVLSIVSTNLLCVRQNANIVQFSSCSNTQCSFILVMYFVKYSISLSIYALGS